MADENAGAEGEAKADQGTEGDTGTDDTTKDGAGEGEADDSADGGADDGNSGNKSGEQSDDADPPVRKSVEGYIIDRKNKKIAKLTEKDNTGSADDEAPKPLTIDDLNTALEPLKRSLVQSEDEKELQSALTKYPDAKKMEKTIRKYMENEAYAKVPVEFIVRGLMGARETVKKQADDEAKASRQGGHTRRPKDTKPKTAWDMTQAEFDKSVADLMSGKTQ